MKYDSVTKRRRNEILVQYAQDNQDLSLEEIAEIFGVTKQRVSVILRKYGVGRGK